MKLYPRLERSHDLEERAENLRASSISDCRSRRRTSDASAIYTATGGSKADAVRMGWIADELTTIAQQHGFPESTHSRWTAVDAEWAVWLHRNLETSAHEAALEGMWYFMCVALVPDLVRWRWSKKDDESSLDRWVTIKRHGRNAFGRLWWRCEILKDEKLSDPYQLVRLLGEDELVQLTERPNLAGNLLLSRTSASMLVEIGRKNPGVNRSNLMREYQKRMLRFGAFMEFQSMGEENIRSFVMEVFQGALAAIGILKKKKKTQS